MRSSRSGLHQRVVASERSPDRCAPLRLGCRSLRAGCRSGGAASASQGSSLTSSSNGYRSRSKGSLCRSPLRATTEVLAAGTQANEMIGRTPGPIRAMRPLRHGGISDFEVTEKSGTTSSAKQSASDEGARASSSASRAGSPELSAIPSEMLRSSPERPRSR